MKSIRKVDKIYNEKYYEDRDHSIGLQVEIDNMIRLLSPQSNDIILEIGCGGGSLLKRLETYNATVIGLDSSEEAVRIAKARVNHCEVILGDGRRMDFADASFDKLAIQHLIEHFSDGHVVLKEWNRVLRNNGILVIVTPNIYYPDKSLFYDESHVHLYSMKELRHLTEMAGFTVEALYSIAPFLFLFPNRPNIGVRLYKFFRFLPYFNSRGRTILLKGRKRESC
jgi:ubiquinone/menaquinone biosynthesis C-methylase UbiE